MTTRDNLIKVRRMIAEFKIHCKNSNIFGASVIIYAIHFLIQDITLSKRSSHN